MLSNGMVLPFKLCQRGATEAMLAFHSGNTQNVRSCFVRTWVFTRDLDFILASKYATLVPGGAISATE